MRGKRVTIFIGEQDRWHHRPLYLAILDRLKAAGCAGATVTRGLAGFGAHSYIKTAHILELSVDMPLTITVVDLADRVEGILPEISAMLAGGTVTVEEIEVHFYSAAFTGGLPDLCVADVMSGEPECVTPDTSIAEVVEHLLASDYTALPVVDASLHVVGMIGDSDLLSAGLTRLSVSLHKAVGPDLVRDVLAQLKQQGTRVESAMTTPAVTVHTTTSLKEAAHLMHANGLKRLPVVESDGRLVGVLGRLDILQSIASGYRSRTAPHTARLPQEHRRVGEIMDTDLPTVRETAPLQDVVDHLLTSRVKRTVVVDDAGRPVGIVTDTDIVARIDPEERPGLLTRLRSRWNAEAERQVRRSYGQRAADVMTAPIVTVRDTASVIEALSLAVTHHVKRLPVTDADGRIVGMVSRPALLAASLDLTPSAGGG